MERKIVTGRAMRWLLPLAAALGAGCAGLQESITPPDVTLTELAIMRVTVDRQDFRVGLRIDNPNPIPLPMEEIRFDIRLGGEGVLAGRSAQAMTLPARGHETLRLEVSSDLVSSVRRLLALVQGPDDALPYELTGQLALARPVRRTVPFRTRGEVPLTATMGIP